MYGISESHFMIQILTNVCKKKKICEYQIVHLLLQYLRMLQVIASF